MAARRHSGRALGGMVILLLALGACSRTEPPPAAEDIIRDLNSATEIRVEQPAGNLNLPRCFPMSGTVTGPDDVGLWLAHRRSNDPSGQWVLHPLRRTDADHWFLKRAYLGPRNMVGQEFEVVTFALPNDLTSFIAATNSGFDYDTLNNGRFISWSVLPPGVDRTPQLWLSRSDVPNEGCT